MFAMAIWGLYFESKMFSNFHAVHHLVKKDRHAFAWGVISTFQAAAYFIGPTFAILLLDKGKTEVLTSTIVLQSMALLGFIIFVLGRRHRHKMPHASVPMHKKSILSEFSAWKVLGKRLWPMLLFAFMLVMIDATFFYTGALMSEEIRHEHPLASYTMAVYLLPGLFIGLFAGKFSKKLGKKKTAFISAFIAGTLLAIAGMVSNVELFLVLVFLSSTAMSITSPLTLGTFEDYIARLGKDASDLIGLENSFTSLSFVVAPILAGLIANFVGYQKTFSFFGAFLAITSLILIFIVPRKIQLPQKAIHDLDWPL